MLTNNAVYVPAASFCAYLSADASNITGDNSIVIVPFDSILTDVSNNFNDGTYTYNVPANGNMLILANIEYKGIIASNNKGAAYIYVNGVNSYALIYNNIYKCAAGDSVYIGNGSIIIPVTKGQLLTMYVGVDGASLTTDIGTNSYFMGTYCL